MGGASLLERSGEDCTLQYIQKSDNESAKQDNKDCLENSDFSIQLGRLTGLLLVSDDYCNPSTKHADLSKRDDNGQ